MPVFEVAVRIDFAGPGSPAYNIWHVRCDTWETWPTDGVKDAVDEIKEFYQAFVGFYPNTVSLKVPEKITRVDTSPPETMAAPVNVLTGTATSGEMPERLAVLLKLQSAHPGRSGRGRKFIGPVSKATCEANGTVDESVRTQWQTFLNNLISASTAGGLGWAIGIWSRKDQLLYDIVAGSVDNEYAQLSSRRF